MSSRTLTSAGLMVVALLGAVAPSARCETAGAGPVAPFSCADATPPKRFLFDRWMDAGRRDAVAGKIELARQRYTAAMEQAWGFIPSDSLAFEALGDALACIALKPEAAFAYQQAQDFLKSMAECETSATAARLERKLGRLPDSARAAPQPLALPAEGREAIERRLSAVSLETVLGVLYRDLAAAPAEKQGQILQTILPARDDVNALFGERAEAVWAVVERTNQDLLRRCGEWVKELQAAGPPAAVLATLIREDEPAGHEDVTAILAPGTSLYTAVVRRSKGDTTTATYVRMDKRWVWFNNLAGVPEALKAPR